MSLLLNETMANPSQALWATKATNTVVNTVYSTGNTVVLGAAAGSNTVLITYPLFNGVAGTYNLNGIVYFTTPSNDNIQLVLAQNGTSQAFAPAWITTPGIVSGEPTVNTAFPFQYSFQVGAGTSTSFQLLANHRTTGTATATPVIQITFFPS